MSYPIHPKKMLWVTVGLGVVLVGCGPKLSKDQYVSAMTELGCKLVGETSPAAGEIYQKLGISRNDISEFRKKAKPDVMMEAVTSIAQNVGKCHGVGAP